METVKDLIFGIFDSVADNAMKRGCSVSIRYENSKYNGKTIISESNKEEDVLTLSVFQTNEEECDQDPEEEECDDTEDADY